MDDIIYGLLIIAWVTYGIYSAAKKNKAKSENFAAKPAAGRSTNTVESIFESLFQTEMSTDPLRPHPYAQPEFIEEDIDNQVNEYRENDYQENDYQENAYLDVVPKIKAESEIDTYAGTDNVQPAIVIDEDDEIKNSAIDNLDQNTKANEKFTFDLRQGIIAQAILERPYL